MMLNSRIKLLQFFTLVLLLTNFATVIFGQVERAPKKVKVIPIPTLGYEPETLFHFGAVALFTFDLYHDSLTRTSNAKVEFNYTLRNQLILETEWSYFFREEQWFSQGLLHFSKFPDYYYGVGSATPIENELLFETNRIDLEGGVYYNLGRRRFTGGGFRYLNYSNLNSDSQIKFDELVDRQNVGLSLSFFIDRRNSLLSASKGSLLRLDTEYNFSKSDYLRMKFDARKYLSISSGFVFAGRFYNQFTFGTPTFYDYAVLGGDDFVRGYFYGRYRDKHLTTFQGEIRTPLLWRLGLSFIAGVSSLYDQPSAISTAIRPNYGLGLRFLVDKEDRINLRFDYVLGNQQNSGFYISFGESF